MTDQQRLEGLKEKIFAQSNEHCFIERERFLDAYPDPEKKSESYYAELLANMLDALSTPIEEEDYFVGRMLEAEPEDFAACPSRRIFAKGHLIPGYERLLRYGYRGVLEQIRAYAAQRGDRRSQDYARNAEIVVHAIRRFALRYADAAEQAGKHRAAEALRRVPYEPAHDLYSALQAIWINHMIASCCVSSRDYAFGYMDEYLYPYYEKELALGSTDGDVVTMLSGFFIKTNEICGRHPHNYRQKPVLSQSSKQYLLLDGGRANHLSELILQAGERNCMAEPIFTVVLSLGSEESFRRRVFDAMAVMTDKLQVYHCDQLKEYLRNKGLPGEIVERPAFSACCTSEIYGHSTREEFYLPTVQLFAETLFADTYESREALLDAYSKRVTKAAQDYLDETRAPDYEWTRMVYVLDALLLGDCNKNCDYPPYGATYRAKNIFLPGIATLGDSLCVMDRLVFRGDLPYSEMIAALRADFCGYEELVGRIAACPKFGNDLPEDFYTAEMAECLLGAVEATERTDAEILMPSFYSLERDNVWAEEIPATPDGRRAGSPISENQSPTYGADRRGITALLNSLAKLPFGKTAAGGLNLTFSSRPDGAILQALVEAYMEQGGHHVGITVLDRRVLEDAMIHPERYRSLTVRLYGFSEYFIGLPKWQQLAVLNRTAYDPRG